MEATTLHVAKQGLRMPNGSSKSTGTRNISQDYRTWHSIDSSLETTIFKSIGVRFEKRTCLLIVIHRCIGQKPVFQHKKAP